MKGYTIFNVEQVEGLQAQYYAPAQQRVETVERIARADAFFAATQADIRSGGNMAYYSAGTDHVQMPPFECFRDAESYYATLAHEMTHWTKHPKRLDRILAASVSAIRDTLSKNWLRSSAPPSCRRILI
jgi:antirestriction protein ArdC